MEGRVMAISGGSDWAEILRLTDQPEGFGLEDFLNRAVRPYFDEALGLLAKATDQLDGLTELVSPRSTAGNWPAVLTTGLCRPGA
jgi:hypothetical protein